LYRGTVISRTITRSPVLLDIEQRRHRGGKGFPAPRNQCGSRSSNADHAQAADRFTSRRQGGWFRGADLVGCVTMQATCPSDRGC